MSPWQRRYRFCRPFQGASLYKPQGVPGCDLEIVELEKDELEAVRFCDYEDVDQEEAAKRMNISRGTVQRLLYSGRKKILDAILHSKALRIIGHEQILPPPSPF
ncbi:MAG: DUF134 domain-containing protein, partial [Candidatus Margulisiibacteriota bacterium]